MVGARAVSRPPSAMVGRRAADRVLTPRVRAVAIGALAMAVVGGAVLLHLLRTDGFQVQPSDQALATAAPAEQPVATPPFEDPASSLDSTKALRAADQGRKLLARGQVKAALSLLADAQKVLPDNAELAHVYGTALWQFKARDRAVFQYQRALKISPDNALYRQDLGRALQAMGRTSEAAHLLQGTGVLTGSIDSPAGVPALPAEPVGEGGNLGGAGMGTFKGRSSFGDADLQRGRVQAAPPPAAPTPAPTPTPIEETPR